MAKRKLDDNDVPVPVSPAVDAADAADAGPKAESKQKSKAEEGASFQSLGLDSRLLQGIVKLGFKHPTLVQQKAIPLALSGKDVLARAKTGGGKTAAYVLPVVNGILRRKEEGRQSSSGGPTALILVPTRELAEQVYKALESFAAFCAKDVRAINLTQKVSDAVQRSLLANGPDLVIATPSRVSANIKNGAMKLDNLAYLVIDEADLVLSFGYEDDLKTVKESVPKGVQTILMSATLTDEVELLKGLFCQDPVVLKLDEKEDEGQGLMQYVVKCAEDEKFLLIYVVFKLKLIKGKCIVFVGDIDRCYRLKLFLEQFGTKACILNSELPVNSRIHVVEEFNKGVYDIIIASDEHEVLGDEEDDDSPVAASDDKGENAEGSKAEGARPAKKKKKAPKRDKDYGVSRGIDFRNVACVLNFDLPTTSKSYTHRIGRTARAGQTGMALSFVIPSSQYRKHKPTSIPSAEHDEVVLAKIIKHQGKRGQEVKPYNFDMAQVEAFRYRMEDALRAVTKVAIREARTREVREELIKSERLKRHFEENPDDLRHLRHDGELRPARVQAHLRHVPEYLLPNGGKGAGAGAGASGSGRDLGFVGVGKTPGTENGVRKRRAFNKAKGKTVKGGVRRDPLKTFKARVGAGRK